MERSWTMVTVMGKGNWERMVLPSTPLLELTMYQTMEFGNAVQVGIQINTVVF